MANGKKNVFIAHPISGDIKGNMAEILRICKEVHTKDGNIIPVVPYMVSLQYLDDTIQEDRELGIEANFECFHRNYVDELWLYGEKISEGMKGEIRLAWECSISVFPKTSGTQRAYEKFLQEES